MNTDNNNILFQRIYVNVLKDVYFNTSTAHIAQTYYEEVA